MIKKHFLLVGIIALAAGLMPATAKSDGIPRIGDFYLMSRDKNGDFTGSHQIFQSQKPWTYKVSYCGQHYWVRLHTIAWAQVESENLRTVQIEFNFGKGWRPICGNPQQQVSLQDLGVAMPPRTVLASSEASVMSNIRYTALKDTLREQKVRNRVNPAKVPE